MAKAGGSVEFSDLGQTDLLVDAIYRGGSSGTHADDPIDAVFRVEGEKSFGTLGGIRARGSADRPRAVAICTSGRSVDWPDYLDPETGHLTYYGDNRDPGVALLDKRGNRVLDAAFANAHGSAEDRATVPPFFVFASTGTGRDQRFLGVAVPGAPHAGAGEDLVAVWRTTGGRRFQNYRALFTILDIPVVSRAWIVEVMRGDHIGHSCPEPIRKWVASKSYEPLTAPRTTTIRSASEQLPEHAEHAQLLRMIYSRFKEDPVEFEGCAALLWRLAHRDVGPMQLTPPSRDGGRDVIGTIPLGPAADPVHLEFALEAKCYDPDGSGVGVRETSRLISRLRHRQFGVLVTTAHVGKQAYTEIRTDRHPVVIISGRDVVKILLDHGLGSETALGQWLEQDFRVAVEV